MINIRSIEKLPFEPFITEQEIKKAVSNLADKISLEWKDKNPIILVVLQGAFVFAADLVRHFPFPVEMEFIRVKSYEGVESTGKIQSVMGLDIDLSGRNVLIVEDIVDTGRTAVFLRETLQNKGAKQISMATFLHKPEANETDFIPDYVGMEIAPDFVVGYGLDYNGKGRHWPGLWRLVSDK